jgi:hypothetical protein
MGLRQEQWTRLDVAVTLEEPRHTLRINTLFVSPGGMFVPKKLDVEPYTQVTVRFSVEERPVVAHAEVRRFLSDTEVQDRGIPHRIGGTELRIVRMEGDGSQILAEHIKKILMESGGPGAG